MTPEEMAARLERAELVCHLFGWTALADSDVRSDAATQAWQYWHASVPEAEHKAMRKAWPDSRLEVLAAERRAIRARTMASIQRMTLREGEPDV